MILTQKAKEDFINWIKEKDYPISLWALEEGLIWKSVEYALIIEWLDSVTIHVNIVCSVGLKSEYYPTLIYQDENFIRRHESINDNNNFNSRQEATKAAIERANEIYNQSPNGNNTPR